MFNILLDELPTEWNGYPIDSDFRTGIQITQALDDEELTDMEKIYIAAQLLFTSEIPSDANKCMECILWFLNGWNYDNYSKNKESERSMDFDKDQGRLFAAFMEQYKINLNTIEMHWWKFMILLSNLQDCAFTRVIDIRGKKITSKMPSVEKNAIKEAKNIYAIKNIKPAERYTEKELEAIETFKNLLNK